MNLAHALGPVTHLTLFCIKILVIQRAFCDGIWIRGFYEISTYRVRRKSLTFSHMYLRTQDPTDQLFSFFEFFLQRTLAHAISVIRHECKVLTQLFDS